MAAAAADVSVCEGGDAERGGQRGHRREVRGAGSAAGGRAAQAAVAGDKRASRPLQASRKGERLVERVTEPHLAGDRDGEGGRERVDDGKDARPVVIVEEVRAVHALLGPRLRAAEVQVDRVHVRFDQPRRRNQLVRLVAAELRHERTVGGAAKLAPEEAARVLGLANKAPRVEHLGIGAVRAVAPAQQPEGEVGGADHRRDDARMAEGYVGSLRHTPRVRAVS